MARELAALDYGDRPPPPRELVEGFARYGRLTLLTGREGSAKSLAVLGLARSIAIGEPWLGLTTERGRVLYVDEENHDEDASERLYGLGLRQEHQDRLRYLCQQSLDLNRSEGLEALEREVERFRPALVIVDGVSSAAPSLDLIDPGGVTRFLKSLRRLARTYDCAVVLLAHVPKSSREDDDDATLGTTAWRSQVDAQFRSKVRRGGAGHYTSDAADGCTVECYRYELRSSSKVRWGAGYGRACPFRTRSERDEDGSMLWLRVELDGDARAKTSSASRGPTKSEQVQQQVHALLQERKRMTRAEIGEALPEAHEKMLDRVLSDDGEGRWTKPERGVYEYVEVPA